MTLTVVVKTGPGRIALLSLDMAKLLRRSRKDRPRKCKRSR